MGIIGAQVPWLRAGQRMGNPVEFFYPAAGGCWLHVRRKGWRFRDLSAGRRAFEGKPAKRVFYSGLTPTMPMLRDGAPRFSWFYVHHVPAETRSQPRGGKIVWFLPAGAEKLIAAKPLPTSTLACSSWRLTWICCFFDFLCSTGVMKRSDYVHLQPVLPRRTKNHVSDAVKKWQRHTEIGGDDTL